MIATIVLLALPCGEPPVKLPPLRPAPQLRSVPESPEEEALRFTAQLDGRDRWYALLRLRRLGAHASPAIPRLLCEVEMHIQDTIFRGPTTQDVGWADDAADALFEIGRPAVKAIVDVLAADCKAAVGRRLDGRPCRNPGMDPELCSWREAFLVEVLRRQGEEAIEVLLALGEDGSPAVRAAAARVLAELER